MGRQTKTVIPPKYFPSKMLEVFRHTFKIAQIPRVLQYNHEMKNKHDKETLNLYLSRVTNLDLHRIFFLELYGSYAWDIEPGHNVMWYAYWSQ